MTQEHTQLTDITDTTEGITEGIMVPDTLRIYLETLLFMADTVASTVRTLRCTTDTTKALDWV